MCHLNGETIRVPDSLAGSRKNGGGQKQTLWIRVNCWGNLSNVAQQYVKKSSLVQATAEFLRPSAWISQDGTPQASIDIDANRLILLDRVENGDSEEASQDIPF